MSVVPSQDQVMAQLRIIIPALGTIVTAFGVTSAAAGSYTQIALASVGPISYVVVAIWSMIVNTQANKIKAVAAMPEVAAVTVNAQAGPSVAKVAVDPTVPKVNPTPEAKAIVTATASAA